MNLKRVMIAFIAGGMLSSAGFSQDLPAPSPKAKVEQRVGLTDFTVEYSRPGVKDREIFGDLVEYGKLWRTGANKATMISFNTPANFAGKNVDAGSYSLFTVPGKKEWKIILNNETELWGTGSYNADNNAAEITVEAQKGEHFENMMIYFDNVKPGSAELVIRWAKAVVKLPVKVDYKEQSVENIEAEINKLTGVFRVYNNAASFYLDNELDPEKALEFAKKSVEAEKRFWNVKTLSEAYAANGDYKSAIEAAELSLQLAKEAEYKSYIKLNEANIAEWKKKL